MLVGVFKAALRRPYTFVVLALLLLIVGPLAAQGAPADLFPGIRIPVLAVANAQVTAVAQRSLGGGWQAGA